MGTVKIKTVVAPLRPARSIDFFYEIEIDIKGKKGIEKRRKIGLTYVFENSKGMMEFYTLHAESSSDEINEFIRAKKCFVIADVNAVDWESKIEEKEVNWIKPEVKQ